MSCIHQKILIFEMSNETFSLLSVGSWVNFACLDNRSLRYDIQAINFNRLFMVDGVWPKLCLEND